MMAKGVSKLFPKKLRIKRYLVRKGKKVLYYLEVTVNNAYLYKVSSRRDQNQQSAAERKRG